MAFVLKSVLSGVKLTFILIIDIFGFVLLFYAVCPVFSFLFLLFPPSLSSPFEKLFEMCLFFSIPVFLSLVWKLRTLFLLALLLRTVLLQSPPNGWPGTLVLSIIVVSPVQFYLPYFIVFNQRVLVQIHLMYPSFTLTIVASDLPYRVTFFLKKSVIQLKRRSGGVCSLLVVHIECFSENVFISSFFLKVIPALVNLKSWSQVAVVFSQHLKVLSSGFHVVVEKPTFRLNFSSFGNNPSSLQLVLRCSCCFWFSPISCPACVLLVFVFSCISSENCSAIISFKFAWQF